MSDEIDYIRIGNLTKIRIITRILRDMETDTEDEDYGIDAEEEGVVQQLLARWRCRLEKLTEQEKE
jgi:hypothetical protein